MMLKGKSVLFFVGPQYEDLELWYPKIRLEEEGAKTVVAGLGEKTYVGKKGYPITVDAVVDDLYPEVYDGPAIPGGYAPDHMRRSEKLLKRHAGHRRGRKAGRLHLPRGVGADLRRAAREGARPPASAPSGTTSSTPAPPTSTSRWWWTAT